MIMANIPNLYEILAGLNENFDYTNDLNYTDLSLNIADPYTLTEFHKYLKRSHCEENLEFFNKTRKYLVTNRDAESATSMDSQANITDWNHTIYELFIKTDAPQQCNFPQSIREVFDLCYNTSTNPKRKDVIKAIEHVLGMLFDAYSHFLNSIQTQELERQLASGQDPSTCLHLQRSITTSDTQSISQDALDIDKINKSIAHLTLTESTVTDFCIPNYFDPQQKTKSLHSRRSSNSKHRQAKHQHSISFLTRSKLFFNRFQKHSTKG